MDFSEAFNTLNTLYEDYSNGYLELAKPIDLSHCREIASDVRDIRDELETSACLMYNDVLTRVAAKVLIFRGSADNKEVLLRFWRSAVYLPGGGFDIVKDNYNTINTIKREVYEELNLVVDNIQPTSYNYWRYDDKPWVHNHVMAQEDRWFGYYTFLYTADYKAEGNNELPEEQGKYKWYNVQDILARPDTKELACIKKAILENGYASLTEDLLTEGKNVGYVSYCVHDTGNRKSGTTVSALTNLAKILQTNTILASTDTVGTKTEKYVSTSRDLVGHLGPAWKCGLVLDGDKLSDRYKFQPVDKNSMIYFGTGGDQNKTLMLQAISKYKALDADEYFYTVDMSGSKFNAEISEETYNILLTVMEAFNIRPAVNPDGWADSKYKGRTNADVHKYTTEYPTRYNKTMMPSRIPARHRDHKWRCVESCGYNVPASGLKLTAVELANGYKDVVIQKHGVDITTPEFFKSLTGKYAAEAEERVTPKLVKLVDAFGVEDQVSDSFYGIDISGCVKAIMVNIKHKPAFEAEDLATSKAAPHLMDNDGNVLPTRYDKLPGLVEAVSTIKAYAAANSIPIIFWNSRTTNHEIINQLK